MPFDPTKPVQTRDGRKVRILCTDMNCDPYTIVAVVTESDGKDEAYVYTSGGKFHYDQTSSPRDLVNVPEERYVWCNVSPNGLCYLFNSRKEADHYAASGRIARIKVKLVEGRFDE